MIGRTFPTGKNAPDVIMNVLTQVAGKKKTESASARYAVTRQSTNTRRSRMISASVRTVVKNKSING